MDLGNKLCKKNSREIIYKGKNAAKGGSRLVCMKERYEGTTRKGRQETRKHSVQIRIKELGKHARKAAGK